MRPESKLHGTEQAILIWDSELVDARGETSHRKTLCEGTSMSLLLVAIAMGGHCWYTCPNIICCLFYLSVGQIYCTNMYQQC